MTDDLFDDDGRIGKAAGMAAAEEHANPHWRVAAEHAVRLAAQQCSQLTTNDVLDRMDPEARTHEPRAWGPVMLQAARAGLIKKALVPPVYCNRPSRHRAPLQVWDSLIRD